MAAHVAAPALAHAALHAHLQRRHNLLGRKAHLQQLLRAGAIQRRTSAQHRHAVVGHFQRQRLHERRRVAFRHVVDAVGVVDARVDIHVVYLRPVLEEVCAAHEVGVGGRRVDEVDVPVVAAVLDAPQGEAAHGWHADAAAYEEQVAPLARFVGKPVAVRAAQPHLRADLAGVQALGHAADLLHRELHVVLACARDAKHRLTFGDEAKHRQLAGLGVEGLFAVHGLEAKRLHVRGLFHDGDNLADDGQVRFAAVRAGVLDVYGVRHVRPPFRAGRSPGRSAP